MGGSYGWYIDDVRISDNTDLTVYAGPDITLDPCGSAALNPSVSGGTEPYTIEWIPSKGLNDPGSLNPIASPTDTTVYTLRVTDASGCFRTDRIVVNANCEDNNTRTDILSYSFGKPPQVGSTVIDAVNHTVNIKVESGTDHTGLVASFILSEGAAATVAGTEQESGVTANDFTDPVTYTITAADGITMQEWVITVTEAAVNDTDFLTYGFGTPPQTGDALINPLNHTVEVEVGNGTALTDLVASFTLSEGAVAKVGGILQESGITSNDFTEPVVYSITAQDNITIQEWTVSVQLQTGIIAEEFDWIEFYPNPFESEATIEIRGAQHYELAIRLFTASGEKVLENKIVAPGKYILHKGILPAGIYYLVLEGEGVSERRKVIIQ